MVNGQGVYDISVVTINSCMVKNNDTNFVST